MEQKYVAAYVPRFIRSTRLSYLPMNCVIGSKLMNQQAREPLMYDVIMLPENAFMRMKLRLASEDMSSVNLTQSNIVPKYTPQNVKEVMVPQTESDPEAFAKSHFLKQFDVD